MQKLSPQPVPTETQIAAALSPVEIRGILQSQAQTIDALKHQLEWLKRQMFGTKSERLAVLENAQQLPLAELAPFLQPAVAKVQSIAAHTRRAFSDKSVGEADSVPFFDEARVPIETILVPNQEIEGLSADQFEVLGEKTSYRLAQRPGSYVVLKYVRTLIKLKETQRIHCPRAPQGVIDGSRADVSFLAGLIVDKMAYHLPLYRQHQRLQDSGIQVSRAWLTQLIQQGIGLLEPIYTAQFDSIRDSRIKAMDETPIKAGRSGHSKMKTGYFWPVYGGQDEVCFPFFPSRHADHVRAALGAAHDADAVLLTDGYAAYQAYAKKVGIIHALCWSHCRRKFFEAHADEPEGVEAALKRIAALYEIEEQIREQQFVGENKRLHRLTYSKPHVEAFFHWIERQFEQQGLTPTRPFTVALEYARERRMGLEVFLTDPDVPNRYQSLGARLACHPDGAKILEFLLDRTRSQARWRGTELDRHVPIARHRPLHVFGGRFAAGRSASSGACHRAYPAAMENSLCRQSAALRLAHPDSVGHSKFDSNAAEGCPADP
jgi:transposase